MRNTMFLRRACRGSCLRRLAALTALVASAALLAAPRLTAPARAVAHAVFPRTQPARLAHLLADFSTHPLHNRGAWFVEDESTNYTSWRYSVVYECGPRCSGRASIETHDEPLRVPGPVSGAEAEAEAGAGPEPAPRHGLAARLHRIVLRTVYCTRLPLLPWLQFCGESETIAEVTGSSEAAAWLSEVASARCSSMLAALMLRGHCGDERALRRLRGEHLQRLRLALSR